MATRLRNVDRDTPLLLPPDLREWVPADDMVHFVLEAVMSMKLPTLKVNRRGSGSKQYPPKMMLALLIYCYANGVFGSRRIERATYLNVAVRYLTGNTHPDHDTLCKFRRENFEAVGDAFLQVLGLARQMGVLKVGTVSVDGTHIRANASKDKNVRYDRAGELEDQLKGDIAELMEQAERMDRNEKDDGQSLPDEIARREKLQEKMQKARERLETQAKARAEAQRGEYERKLADREQREGSRKGPKPQPPDETPDDKEQTNLTDPDSKLMRKSKREGYTQSYNCQATVDADGSQLILGGHVTDCASDAHELTPAVEAAEQAAKFIESDDEVQPEQAENEAAQATATPNESSDRTQPDGSVAEATEPSPNKIKAVLADSGYVNADAIEALEKDGPEVYVAIGREENHDQRRYDYRPKSVTNKPSKQVKDPRLVAMREKVRRDEGKKLYAKRKQTVEPVFGIIKNAMGYRQFLLRGMEKVEGEWSLLRLAYNFKRLWGLKATA